MIKKCYSSILPLLLTAMLISSSGCTVRLSESTFITQSDDVKAYQADFIKELHHAMPGNIIESVELQADQHTMLRGFHIDNPNSNTLLLFFPGNGMKVEPHSLGVLTHLAKLETDILIFDRRGLGASQGTASIANLITDAASMLQFAHQQYQPNKVIVHGFSLGSFIAAQLAKSQQVDALVLQGSATNVDDWIDEKTPWYMPFLSIEMSEGFRRVDNEQVVSQDYQGPLLIIGAQQDDQVPASLSETLYRASQSPIKQLIMVPNANHQTMFDDPNTLIQYRAFIAQI
ncbi:alpha/beta hydrolase [Shewanella maritima]|uniref:alpha/beta hydrolase n=1 Tax=Shewanella maritima TaxID=2520507 RepID=UPI003735EAAB